MGQRPEALTAHRRYQVHPDTYDVRKNAKLLNEQSFIDALSDLYRNHAISSVDDIDEDAIIADQARATLLGTNYGDHVVEELNAQVMDYTRPNGLVQAELANHGSPMSLCSTQVSRKLTDEDGVEYVVRKTARFATDVAEIAAQFLLKPQYTRMDKTIERIALMSEEHTRRIPALARYTPAMIQRTHSVLQNQLPAPKPKKQGP